METFALRLVLPSLTVLLAGWVQHRLGPRHSGRLIGLPLTSGPFLAVLLAVEGEEATVSAARGVATGQLMVVGFTAAYASLTSTRWRPVGVLVAAVSAVALLAGAAHAWLAWPAGLVVPVLAAATLAGWRPERLGDNDVHAEPRSIAARGLLARGALTGCLVAGLSLTTPLLGPSLTGLLASVPLVVAVLAPSAHGRGGGATVRALLRGTLAVVPGTAAFAVVVALALSAWGAAATFGLALAVLFTVNWLVDAADGATQRRRQLLAQDI